MSTTPEALLNELERLAGLDDVTYQTERREVAKGLGVPSAFLDKDRASRRKLMGRGNEEELAVCVTPWDDPVNGAELFREVEAAFNRHLILPDYAPVLAAVWTMAAHLYEYFEVFPYVFYTSPEAECGKSTALDVHEALADRPIKADSITAAALFRTIEETQPTLLLDEVDGFVRRNPDVQNMLNSGHRRGQKAIRMEKVGEAFKPRGYRVYCPKVLGGLGTLRDTLESRSLVIPMERKLAEQRVQPLRPHREALAVLARKLVRWSLDARDAVWEKEVPVPDFLGNRAADNAVPLLQVARLVGSDVVGDLIACLQALAEGTERQSPGVWLLEDVRAAFERTSASFIASEDLLMRLIKLEDRPWGDWRQGRPITTHGLARQLKKYKIRPAPSPDRTKRGYYRDAFEGAWARYVLSAPKAAEQPSDPSEASGRGNGSAKEPPGPSEADMGAREVLL